MKHWFLSSLLALFASACGPVLASASDGGAVDGCVSDGGDGGCLVPRAPSSPTSNECARYCQRASALSCTSPIVEAECAAACVRARELLQSAPRCQAAFDAVIRCRATTSLRCAAESGDVDAPSCAAEEAAAERCGE
jgi:hypothetical protein